MKRCLLLFVLVGSLFAEHHHRRHSVALTWTASITSGVDYRVYRSQQPDSGFAPIASTITSTSYTDGSVLNGQTYYYVVTAYDEFGESNFSNEVQAVVP